MDPMRNYSLKRRHYVMATALLLAIVLLVLLYVQLVVEHRLPDVRPWLLGQAVFQEDQDTPDELVLEQELPVPAFSADEPIAAGATSVGSDLASEISAPEEAVESTSDDDAQLPPVFLPDTSLAATELQVESIPDSELVSEPTPEPEQAVEPFDSEDELVSTPGTESEGRQVPRLDLDLPRTELESLVHSGHLQLIVRARDRRSRPRFLRAEPVGNGYRVRSIGDSEVSGMSSRHIGHGRDGLARDVLASTSVSLRSMNLDNAELSVRFTAETDRRLEQRQFEALSQAGVGTSLQPGQVVSTRGRLVDCGSYLDLSISQVRKDSDVFTINNGLNPCE